MRTANVPWPIRSGEYDYVEGPTIKVRALRDGEYEYCRRREGDVFTLKPRIVTVCHPPKLTDGSRNPMFGQAVMENGEPKTRILTAEEQFSNRWMERVDDSEPERTTPAQAALDRAHVEINEGRRPGRSR